MLRLSSAKKSKMLSEHDQTTIKFLGNSLYNIQDMYLERLDLLKGRDRFDLVRKKKIKEAIELQRVGDQAALLLEYMYIFGTIILNRVCSLLEKHIETKPEKRIRKMSYRAFLEKYEGQIPLSDSLKQRLYCFVIYRHRLIEHHDKLRANASLGSAQEIRLCSMGEPFLNGKGDASGKIVELVKKYKYSGDLGINKILSWLFYHIPYNVIDYKNSDRKLVDDLIEEWGCCESLSFNEIKNLFEYFFREIDALKA